MGLNVGYLSAERVRLRFWLRPAEKGALWYTAASRMGTAASMDDKQILSKVREEDNPILAKTSDGCVVQRPILLWYIISSVLDYKSAWDWILGLVLNGSWVTGSSVLCLQSEVGDSRLWNSERKYQPTGCCLVIFCMDAGFMSSVNYNELSSLLPSLYSFLNSTNYISKNNFIYASESLRPDKLPQATQLNSNIFLWRYKSYCHISPIFCFLFFLRSKFGRLGEGRRVSSNVFMKIWFTPTLRHGQRFRVGMREEILWKLFLRA